LEELIELIKERRSIGKVKEKEVPKETVCKLLDAAIYAPNHFRTQPWRFIVFMGKGREKLAQIFDAAMLNGAMVFRAPVILTVISSPKDDPKIIEREEYAAVCAACQNILLAAWCLGLGAIWRTGEAAYNKKVKELLGLKEKEEIVAFIYVGYKDIKPRDFERTPFEEKTTWILTP